MCVVGLGITVSKSTMISMLTQNQLVHAWIDTQGVFVPGCNTEYPLSGHGLQLVTNQLWAAWIVENRGQALSQRGVVCRLRAAEAIRHRR
jgi:hypothetical protein